MSWRQTPLIETLTTTTDVFAEDVERLEVSGDLVRVIFWRWRLNRTRQWVRDLLDFALVRPIESFPQPLEDFFPNILYVPGKDHLAPFENIRDMDEIVDVFAHGVERVEILGEFVRFVYWRWKFERGQWSRAELEFAIIRPKPSFVRFADALESMGIAIVRIPAVQSSMPQHQRTATLQ